MILLLYDVIIRGEEARLEEEPRLPCHTFFHRDAYTIFYDTRIQSLIVN